MRTTFEGEHRSGKGTQIQLLEERSETDLYVVRGDGSYQGGLEEILGQHQVDIRNALNDRLYRDHSHAVKQGLWAAAANLCACVVSHPELVDKDVLIDRGPLSRASFLISAGLEGKEVLENMYPEYSLELGSQTLHGGAIDVEAIDFGKIVYLQVPTPVLLERVSNRDPKADFRRQNIRNKQGLFEKAIDIMPRSVRDSIEIVDGDRQPEDVYRSIADI